MEFKRCPIPQRVDHGVQVNSRRIKTGQGCRHLDDDGSAGIHRGGDIIFGGQRLDRIDAVIRFLLLLFLLLLLLPVLKLLLPVLQTLGVRSLGQGFYGVRLADQLSQRVCRQILHGESQRVPVDQHRVSQPVGQRVFLLTGLHDKCRIGIEVQSLDDGQLRIAITEKDLDTLCVLTLRLQQIAVSL